MIEKYGGGDIGMSDDQDFDKAVGYCSSILTNCPESVDHVCMKIEFQLKAWKLKEASSFTAECMKRPTMMNVPKIIAWRGRVIYYAG